MDIYSSEHVTVLERINDLQEQILKVDQQVFASYGQSPARIILYPDVPSNGIPTTSFGTMASYVHHISRRKEDIKNLSKISGCSEHYAIWTGELSRKIECWSRDVNLVSMGDKGIQDVWLLGAITLVRYRVLSHTDWFPKAKIRTVSSMTKYSNLLGADVFHGMRQLRERYANDKRQAHLIDSELTQWLVVIAGIRKYSSEDIFALLTTG